MRSARTRSTSCCTFMGHLRDAHAHSASGALKHGAFRGRSTAVPSGGWTRILNGDVWPLERAA